MYLLLWSFLKMADKYFCLIIFLIHQSSYPNDPIATIYSFFSYKLNLLKFRNNFFFLEDNICILKKKFKALQEMRHKFYTEGQGQVHSGKKALLNFLTTPKFKNLTKKNVCFFNKYLSVSSFLLSQKLMTKKNSKCSIENFQSI